MKCKPYGRDAVLLEFADQPGEQATERRLQIMRALETSPLEGLRQFVPGFTNILLEFDRSYGLQPEAIARKVQKLLATKLPRVASVRHIEEISVRYDGVDLERVAQHHRISIEEVIRYHSEPVYRVELLGFAPGFPYLGGLNPRLITPRLPSPRTRITAGSVAIGGEHTGVYTVDSPGGWNIIGHTETRIFDVGRRSQTDEQSAFLLKPGDGVKFVPL